MTDTTTAARTEPVGGTHGPANTQTAAVRRTRGKPNTPARGIDLDLCLGTRPETTCAICGTPLPAVTVDRFELETEHGGVICAVDADRLHRPLRLSVLLLNTILEWQGDGRGDSCREALQAVLNGIEMTQEGRPGTARQRPVRNQPNRATRRRQRR